MCFEGINFTLTPIILKHILAEKLHDAYRLAIKAAIKETDLPKKVFPTGCPYSLEQALDDDFYP